jgi:hypothetical protein
MEDYFGMADSLTSSITRVLMESHNTDLSGKFSLFTLYSDNSSVLHIFEDEETFEAMKYKFSSNDNIKRLGASRLPENTTFKKLSESIERKFNVPRETISVRTHDPMPKEQPQPKKVVNEMRKAPMQPKKGSVVESVLKGRERFSNQPRQQMPQMEAPKEEPTINSFRPAFSQKIDLSKLNNGDRPMLG